MLPIGHKLPVVSLVYCMFVCVFQVLVMGKMTYLAYLLQFSILHIAFCTVMFNYFAKLRKEYATFPLTMGTMAIQLLGGGDFKPGSAAEDDEFARFWVIFYCIAMTFIFSNIFISIICDMIAGANEELRLMQENIEFDPIDYFGGKLRELGKSVKDIFNIIVKTFNQFNGQQKVQKNNQDLKDKDFTEETV